MGKNPEQVEGSAMVAIKTTQMLVYAMMEKMQSFDENIRVVPGLPPMQSRVLEDSYADSPFVDVIAVQKLPKKFVVPKMEKYKGTTDPEDHVSQKVCMCKGFGNTLAGPTLKWYLALPNISIVSFADMVNKFTFQFARNRMMPKLTSDLFKIIQKTNESTRDYLQRFNNEKTNIPHYDVSLAIEEFTQRL